MAHRQVGVAGRTVDPSGRGWGATAHSPLWAGFPTPAVISDLPTMGLPKPGGWARAGVDTGPCHSGLIARLVKNLPAMQETLV